MSVDQQSTSTIMLELTVQMFIIALPIIQEVVWNEKALHFEPLKSNRN